MRRTATVILIGLNLGLLALFGAQTSQAHSGSAFFVTWPNNHNENYYFDDDVPSGWRDHIHFGLAEWSNRDNGRSPNFVRSGEVDRTFDYAHVCAGPRSYVYVRGDLENTLGNRTIGATALCGGDPPQKFVMLFEQTPSTGAWYVGSLNPPDGRWDLRSIATHESGHAAGFWDGPNDDGHFSEGDAACPDANADRSTMCPGRIPEDRGTNWMRSLADAHDLHTLRDAY